MGREAAVNQARTNGATPLYIAALKGHLPAVPLLLDRGAAVNQAKTDGATPLYIAAQEGPPPRGATASSNVYRLIFCTS